uniref:Uncharacterized protein n=1 Tax=Candidatus Kentrum sp. TC TaxID=2126339 RepID=A0A451AGQ0_9GAMM|nr:MAG: hypothetical protein BECKTC1821E_GA0114239_11442 [Candidatus Kentron sp. TC]VFK52315.1 MAG: hypothetical protein BECKTC1821D_GA0114238_11672 [Candidatus Kentron sp. TC]VFK65217.1 MAG: hypothetical protein BECKTC1821F_GA0114240_11721 [Candidatus Kentron sp. TC]
METEGLGKIESGRCRPIHNILGPLRCAKLPLATEALMAHSAFVRVDYTVIHVAHQECLAVSPEHND